MGRIDGAILMVFLTAMCAMVGVLAILMAVLLTPPPPAMTLDEFGQNVIDRMLEREDLNQNLRDGLLSAREKYEN